MPDAAPLTERVKWLAGKTGAALHCVLGARTADALGILVYHRIAPVTPGVMPPSMNVTPARFERQLRGLRDLGYRFISLAEALARGGVARRSLVVTFDDGFGSVYGGAWPVLLRLRIPATVFLNTAFVDDPGPFPFDPWGRAHQGQVPAASYRPLTLTECREMRASGLVEFGAHTQSHADFRGRPLALEEDLRLSSAWLRERLGVEAVAFAFPYGRRYLGYVDDALIGAARRAGVTCALTTEASCVEPRSDPTWGRFNAYDWDDAATLVGKLSGWYGWAPRLQERLAARQRRQEVAAP